MSDEATRTIEEQIEIAAAPEVVWQALTDPSVLTNWFPLAAKVTPGQGGEVWFSWKNEFEVSQRIEVWEENHHLRLVDIQDQQHSRPFQTVMDYHLRGVDGDGDGDGKTALRLVHAGFPADVQWDNLFDSTRRGWQFELPALRNYLEHHRGGQRCHVWLRFGYGEDPAVVWERLLGRHGLCAKGDLTGAQPGDSYAIQTGAGDLFEGTVINYTAAKDVALVLVNMNHSLMRLKLDPAWDGSGRTEVNLFLFAYGIHHDDTHTFHLRWQYQLREIFPGAEELPAPALVG